MSTLVKVSSYHSVLMLCEPLDDVDAMYLGKVSDARLLLCINFQFNCKMPTSCS